MPLEGPEGSNQPERQPRVTHALFRLEDAIASLENRLTMLSGRLNCVSRPSVPTSDKELQEVETAPSCELEGRVMASVKNVEDLDKRITALYESLEI